MSEHTTKITSRAMAIPFQFLCGGLLLPSSWSAGCDWVALAPGVVCCSCFMAVIPLPPASELTLPRGHFTLGDRHLASDRMSQTPRRSRNWRKGRAAAAVGWGVGSAREGTESGGRGKQAPLFAGSLFSTTADPRTPHCPRPPTTTRKCRHQTRPSGKLVERRAARCQHLIAPERWLATPEEPGFHSTAVRHPRTRTAAGPPGLPARCSARQVQQQQKQ